VKKQNYYIIDIKILSSLLLILFVFSCTKNNKLNPINKITLISIKEIKHKDNLEEIQEKILLNLRNSKDKFSSNSNNNVKSFDENKYGESKIEKLDTNYNFTSEMHSKVFTVNGLKCFWDYEINENEYRLKLINYEKKSEILVSADLMMIGIDNISLDDTRERDFKDVNFDGYKDFVEYRPGLSGSGGALYIVYVYNSIDGKFGVSDLSGTNLSINKTNNSLYSSMKSSAGFYAENIKYFDSFGEIKYVEEITNKKDSLERWIRTYKKMIKNKVIEIRIDTIFDK